jgi:hypothetical protein
MNCTNYFQVSLPACATSIVVRAGLTPAQSYTWTVRDLRFDTHYIGTAIADVDGNITIPTGSSSLFPPGLFNHNAGYFELTVKADPDQCTLIDLTFCTIAYAGALFSFYEAIGPDSPAIIGCEC